MIRVLHGDHGVMWSEGYCRLNNNNNSYSNVFISTITVIFLFLFLGGTIVTYNIRLRAKHKRIVTKLYLKKKTVNVANRLPLGNSSTV